MMIPIFIADDTTISVQPFFQAIEPYIVAGIGAVITVFFSYLSFLLKKKFGIDIENGLRDSLQTAAINGATKAIAGIEGSFSNAKIDVRSALVAEGMEYLQLHAPDAIRHFGLTEDALRQIILAKLGYAQVINIPQTSSEK